MTKLHACILIAILAFSLKIIAQETKIKLTINDQTELTATLVDNSSVTALIELLKVNPLIISMSDYGNMEKVGSIGTTLPRNDEQITTAPGDIILYLGGALVIYYAPNSYNFTRLGKIDNVSQAELKSILGSGAVTVKLELLKPTDISDNNWFDTIIINPNPVGNHLNILGQYETITLMDIHGRVIMKSKSQLLDVSNITSGIYLLKIESDNNKTIIKKIIKT